MIAVWARVRFVIQRWRSKPSWEASLDEELRAYLAHDIDDRMAGGLSHAEARRAAHAALGGVEPVKEHVRTGVAGASLDVLLQDVRHAARSLRRAHTYAPWVVASLAIGMSVAIAAIALLNATMVLPFAGVTHQERLVRVSVSQNCGRPDCWTVMATPVDYDRLRSALSSLQDVAAYVVVDVAVGVPDARAMRGIVASANYFDVLGVRPELGRGFHAGDAASQAPVALIAHRTWTRDFGADPNVLGRTLRVADRFVEVIGVAPPYFAGVDRDRPGSPRTMGVGTPPDLWLPLWLIDAAVPQQDDRAPALAFVGRLRDGRDAAHVHREAEALAHHLASARGDGAPGGTAEVLPLRRVGPRATYVGALIVMPVPVLVLAIACVNAANLMLARGARRGREVAIRLAIGAPRGRIIRQSLIESALLALVATSIAVPVAWMAMQVASPPLGLPIPLDTHVLSLTIVVAAVTTIAFGLAPSLRVSTGAPLTSTTAAGLPTASGRSAVRRGLVIAQVALSLALLATGSQLIATVRLQGRVGGVPADRLLIARFDLQPVGLASAEATPFYRDLVERAVRLPGVVAAGVARHSAVWGFDRGSTPASLLVWRPGDDASAELVVRGGYAGGDLFHAVGLRVLEGRGFTDADRHPRPLVAVVNAPAAARLGPDALGSTIRVAPLDHDHRDSLEVRVIGVIEATVEPRLDASGPPAPRVYLPAPLEGEPALSLYLRTEGDATRLAQPVRDVVRSLNARVPVQAIGTLDDFNERTYSLPLWLARAAAVLGLIGLGLATGGLYGVTSYLTSLRSRELAIRIAVGARPRAIIALVLGQSLRMAAAGLIVGVLIAVAVSRVIQAEYHGILAIDSTAFTGAILLFLAAMLGASALPARRASRIDPLVTLRAE